MSPSQQWEGIDQVTLPPGFPPIQGLENAESTQQSLVGVLETAMKLANHDEGSEEEEEEAPKKVQRVRAEVGCDKDRGLGQAGVTQPHSIGLPLLGCGLWASLFAP